MVFADVVKQYGPLRPLTLNDSWRLSDEGKGDCILTIIGTDVPWEDLPENDRPSAQELAENFEDETPETYSELRMVGVRGHHIVNVEYRFATAKPLPPELDTEVEVEVPDFSEVDEAANP